MAEFAGMERALTVMAVSLALQTALMVAAIVGAWVAYRRTAAAAAGRDARAAGEGRRDRADRGARRARRWSAAPIRSARPSTMPAMPWRPWVTGPARSPRRWRRRVPRRRSACCAACGGGATAASGAAGRMPARPVDRRGPVVRARVAAPPPWQDHDQQALEARRHRVRAKSREEYPGPRSGRGSHLRRPCGRAGVACRPLRIRAGAGAAGGDARVTERCPQRQPAIGSTRSVP